MVRKPPIVQGEAIHAVSGTNAQVVTTRIRRTGQFWTPFESILAASRWAPGASRGPLGPSGWRRVQCWGPQVRCHGGPLRKSGMNIIDLSEVRADKRQFMFMPLFSSSTFVLRTHSGSGRGGSSPDPRRRLWRRAAGWGTAAAGRAGASRRGSALALAAASGGWPRLTWWSAGRTCGSREVT